MVRSHIRSKSTFVGLLIALIVAAVAPATAAAGSTRPATLSMHMGDHCVNGRTGDYAHFDFLWTAAGGATKFERTDSEANSDGTFEFCSFPNVIVEKGDHISVDDGNSVHELIVPELTLFQDRVDDVYKGRGPAGQYVRLICGLSNGFEPCQATWKLHVNSQGKWSFNPHWNVRGADRMGLNWKSAAGDLVRIWNNAPYLDVTVGLARVSGAGRAGGPVTVVLKKQSNLAVRGTAHTTANPDVATFLSRFEKASGSKVTVAVGNIVTSDIAADADWIVPNISAVANGSTNEITGQCSGEEGTYDFLVVRNGHGLYNHSGFTDETGMFESEYNDLRAGDRVVVGCELSTGDWVRKRFTAN